MFKLSLLVFIFILFGCSLPDASSPEQSSSKPSDSGQQNISKNNKLNPYAIPKDCQLRKMFVFKVVCDPVANLYGIDHSFVEAICESEIEMLEGMPTREAFKFLKQRAEFFSKNIGKFHEYSQRAIYINMSGVKVNPIISSEYSEQVTCSLNSGKDFITLNAHVLPYCNDRSEVYHYARCGVRINRLRISNNGAIIQNIEMPEDSISPEVGYELNSGFIYKNFSALKESKSTFNGVYGTNDPHEQDIYMKKDTSQFLDKYR